MATIPIENLFEKEGRRFKKIKWAYIQRKPRFENIHAPQYSTIYNSQDMEAT